jgi:plastocyanin
MFSFTTAPASIVSSPENITVEVSSSIQFICVVVASHNVTLTWSRDGVTLEAQDASTVILKTQVNGTFYNSSLKIPRVRLSHNGTYACHVSNQVSSGGPSASESSPDFYIFVQSEQRIIYVVV